MKIISYNLNGLRAAVRLNVLDWLKQEDADIICLQEVRAEQKVCEEILKEFRKSYNITFNCGEKKGYSGTVTLSKIKPIKVILGLINDKKDIEGRTIITIFDEYVIINSYVPNGSKRLEYKKNFLKDLKNSMQELLKNNKKIFLCCDANIAHNEIDVNKPKETSKKSGFLLEERRIIDEILEIGFVDTFRELNQNQIQYTWRSYKARTENDNYGWRFRFDYIMCNNILKEKLRRCYSPDLKYSDHLPVILEVE